MFRLSCRHADKINRLPYRIPLAKINIVFQGSPDSPNGQWKRRTFQCVYGAAGDVSKPVLV